MLRVIFAGTPEFAVPSLEAIVAAGHEVPLVITAPDRPAGRGRKMTPSAVKNRAVELGIPVTTPESLKDEAFLSSIRSLEPDVLCVVAFRILPPDLYTIPKRGSFNLHGSLLPKYRGAAPINRALMAGEKTTGVTTFFLRKKVDTGGIILQRTIEIGSDTTAGELHDEMMILGAEAVVDTLKLIQEDRAEPVGQDDEIATAAPKIFREDCRIDWSRPAHEIHNHIRGLSPYPGAWTRLGETEFKILRSRVEPCPASIPEDPGRIAVLGDRLISRSGEGCIEILELKPAGSRQMSAAAFLHGKPLESGARFT